MTQRPDDKSLANPNAAKTPAETSTRAEINAFLSEVKRLTPATGTGLRGRLIFALDATMSRQPTWDTACRLQADMFREAASIGGLDVQLVYFRGLTECRSSPWVSQAERLASLMEKIDCRGGHTQIGKVSRMPGARPTARRCRRWSSSATPWRRSSTTSATRQANWASSACPAFMFQEGDDPIAEQAFREIARLTRGAYCRFDPGAAHQLGELLRAVAAYAAGGMRALADLSARRDAGAIKLIRQMRQ